MELDLSASPFAKQFKRAYRSGARWAAVIGEGEAETGELLLKPLREGSGDPAQELRLPLADLAGLQARLSGLPGVMTCDGALS